MREVNDYYTVEIDRLYEEAGQTTKSGIIKLNDAYIEEEQGDEARFVHKRLQGKVVSAPLHFSQEPAEVISPGLPEPRSFISGDRLMYKYKMGDRHFSKKDYEPVTFEAFEVVTLEEYAKLVDIRPGDQLYFDETVTEPENFVGMSLNMKRLYRCRVDHIICVLRDEQIIPQGTWALVEPDMETWAEITSPGGIIMKVQPEAKYLKAIVRHIPEWDTNKPGDHIMYLPDSNWSVKVEGQEFFGIRLKEIICTVKKQNETDQI